MDIARRIALLRSTQFLRESSDALLAALAAGCEELRLRPGEVLFEQGDPGDALYIVDEGVLEVYVGDTHLDESHHGECLGEMALLTDEHRSASIRAKQAATLLKLPKSIFKEVLERNPELALGIIRELASKVKSSIRARIEQHRFTVRLEEAFARTLSRSVLENLLASRNPDEGAAESDRLVTALFADVRPVAVVWERLDTDQLVQCLNEYLAAMVEVVLDFGGTLDRFMGEGILAHFGAPSAGRKDAWRAVQCALQMRARVDELNRSARFLPEYPMVVGIGLATGPYAGNLGRGRVDYSAIGDVVNLAAGIEGVARVYRTGLLMCDETARHIGSDLLLREVDRVRLKGRGRPTHIYDVLAAPEEATPDLIRLLGEYRYAFALYAGGRFEEAAMLFEGLARAFPDDGPAVTLAERCRRLRSDPPSGWECVFEPAHS